MMKKEPSFAESYRPSPPHHKVNNIFLAVSQWIPIWLVTESHLKGDGMKGILFAISMMFASAVFAADGPFGLAAGMTQEYYGGGRGRWHLQH